jgi:hypothetical protein
MSLRPLFEPRCVSEKPSVFSSKKRDWPDRRKIGAGSAGEQHGRRAEKFKILLRFNSPSPKKTPEVRRLARIGATRLKSYRHWDSGRRAFLRRSRWRQLREVFCAFVRHAPPFVTNSCRN